MKDYESIFILVPTLSEDDAEKVSLRMQEVVTGNGGEIVKVEKWGKKKLAYEVKKHKKGEYILIQFKGEAATVSELERNYKLTDSIIKFMTVKLEKEALVPPVPVKPEHPETPEATAAEGEAPAAETAVAEG